MNLPLNINLPHNVVAGLPTSKQENVEILQKEILKLATEMQSTHDVLGNDSLPLEIREQYSNSRPNQPYIQLLLRKIAALRALILSQDKEV
jgi:hypothetical protein